MLFLFVGKYVLQKMIGGTGKSGNVLLISVNLQEQEKQWFVDLYRSLCSSGAASSCSSGGGGSRKSQQAQEVQDPGSSLKPHVRTNTCSYFSACGRRGPKPRALCVCVCVSVCLSVCLSCLCKISLSYWGGGGNSFGSSICCNMCSCLLSSAEFPPPWVTQLSQPTVLSPTLLVQLSDLSPTDQVQNRGHWKMQWSCGFRTRMTSRTARSF